MPEYGVTDFRVAKNIQYTVDKFVKENNIAETIGLHIRRTDNSIAIEKSPESLFYEAINNEIIEKGNRRFFIASDDDAIIEKLQSEYPNKIITFAKNKRRNNQEGIEQAVAELFILSKTQKVYGSFWSSFSEMAIQLNGNTASKLLSI
jgi:hypothetical protein